MISLQDVHHMLKKTNTLVYTLKDITLTIKPREIVGIVDDQGAGNLLLRCINLLTRPTGGKIVINDVDLTTLSTNELRQARKNIGMIFQNDYLLDTKTVVDNIALPLEFSQHSVHQRQSAVQSLIELTGLQGKETLYPYQLSASEKQRAAIARALVNQPAILLCEEIGHGLEPKAKQSIVTLLKTIQQQFNLTLIIATQEMNMVKSLCHRIIMLDQGEIIEDDAVIDFLTHPKTDIAREFIQTAARRELPSQFKTRLSRHAHDKKNPLLHLAFPGATMTDPGLSDLATLFDVSIHIIQAHLEKIYASDMGVMIAELIGKADNIKEAIEALRKKDISVEVLGYVS
jgi:D-methionine transport system ATP-binding protein